MSIKLLVKFQHKKKQKIIALDQWGSVGESLLIQQAHFSAWYFFCYTLKIVRLGKKDSQFCLVYGNVCLKFDFFFNIIPRMRELKISAAQFPQQRLFAFFFNKTWCYYNYPGHSMAFFVISSQLFWAAEIFSSLIRGIILKKKSNFKHTFP